MKSFFKSFAYAYAGIKYCFKERNFKVELGCALIVLLLAFIVEVKSNDWCILLLCIALVLSLEAVNTAIEGIVNLVEPNQHPIAGKIKDVAAGAVLIASIISLAIGVLVFSKYYFK